MAGRVQTPWTAAPALILFSMRVARGRHSELRTGEGSGGHAAGDSLRGFEHIIGSEHADTLTGDDADNVIEGGAGADTLDGGAGVDTVSYTGSRDEWSSVGVRVNLRTGEGFGGHAEGDSLRGVENIIGSEGMDTLTGDDGDNVIAGGYGDDRIEGGGGADTLMAATAITILSPTHGHTRVSPWTCAQMKSPVDMEQGILSGV